MDDKGRLEVIKKVAEFDCLDYKLELESKVKRNKVFRLEGKTIEQVLKSYLKGKGHEDVEGLLRLDKEL